MPVSYQISDRFFDNEKRSMDMQAETTRRHHLGKRAPLKGTDEKTSCDAILRLRRQRLRRAELIRGRVPTFLFRKKNETKGSILSSEITNEGERSGVKSKPTKHRSVFATSESRSKEAILDSIRTRIDII
jgi:hypothetical protein